MLLAVLALVGSSGPVRAQGESTASIHGIVSARPVEGGGPLAGALVVARHTSGRTIRSVTNEDGLYRIDGLRAGIVEVTVSRIGYRSHRMEVRLPPGGDLALDVELSARPVVLPRILVRGPPDPEGRPGQSDSTGIPAGDGSVSVALQVLDAAPGLAETLPGSVATRAGGSPFQGDGLYARSARADPGLVLLDGAPVRTPFSLTGLLPNLDTTVVRGVRRVEGGAPARYDGGLSQVLELRTRRPGSELRGHASVDGISTSGALEGGLWPGSSVLLAGRALHDQGSRLADGSPLPVGYGEGLLRLESVLQGSTLAVTAFRNREQSRLVTPAADSAGGSGEGGATPEASWGNTVLVARWRGRVGGRDTRAVGSWSRYDVGVSPTGIGRARTDRARSTLEVATPALPGVDATGITADWIRHRTGDGANSSGRGAAETWILGGFAEGAWRSGPLAIRWGARLDRFSPGRIRAAFRSRLQWHLPDPGTVLTFGVGRFHQVGTDLADGPDFELAVSESSGALPEGEEAADATEMTVARGDHVIAGLDQAIGEQVALSTRLHFKSYRNLPGPGSSRLASSGAELRVGWSSGSRAVGVGYGLTWTWERDGEAPRFDERHLLVARGRTSLPGSMDLRVAFSWGDGLPLASIRLDPPAEPEEPGTPPPPAPLPDDFLRVDAELSALWLREAGGREFRLRPYLRVLNGLGSRDNLFRYAGPAGDGRAPGIAGLALLPVLGLEVTF